MNKHVIFIGNGLNRITEEKDKPETILFSPQKLLSVIFENYEQTNFIERIDDFSYAFEVLLNLLIQDSDYNKEYNKCITRLEEYFKNIYKTEENRRILQFYESLFSLVDIDNIKAILTTNYDKFLYMLLDAKSIKSNQRDGVYRYSINNNSNPFLFYTHGNLLEKSHKICAGYLAYTRVCKRLFSNIKISHIKADDLKKSFDNKIIHLPDWAQFFFKNDIHIIGYSLSSYERDIWSILTFRSYIIKRYGVINNTIYFYQIHTDSNPNNEYYKSLEAFNIKVITIYTNSYQEGYKEAFRKMNDIITS